MREQLSILEGGSVGVGIYPTEFGKDQVMEHLSGYDEIHFMGDKYTEEGNDYPLMCHPRVVGVPVDDVNDTVYFLRRLLEKSDRPNIRGLVHHGLRK